MDTHHGKDEQPRVVYGKKAFPESMRGLPTLTRDGRCIRLLSAIAGEDELDAVFDNDSEGVGLFGSEALYLGREDAPGEEELFHTYSRVVKALGERPAVFRTLDVGAGDGADYLGLEDEKNPALGLRGVRLCMDRPQLFKTQLRAIYHASNHGRVGIAFPMVTSLWEVRRCKRILAEVRSELLAGNGAIGPVELGILIDTPAAALTADRLAKEVDFFSVDTDRLTQYTLAADRGNSQLKDYMDPHHPAVLGMLEFIAQAAQGKNIWAGVCGALAADTGVTEALINMGYSEFSVPPACTLTMRRCIRGIETAFGRRRGRGHAR